MRGDRRGRHDRRERPRAGHAGGDRRRGDRGGAGRRGGRPHPRARPRDRAAARATSRSTARWSSACAPPAPTRCSTSPPGWAATSCSAATDAPLPPDAAGTDMVGAEERLAHVAALRPEICTLDCGSMNFAAGGDYVMVNTPAMLRAMARADPRRSGCGPSSRCSTPATSCMVEQLIRDGLIDDPPLDPALHGHPVRRAGRPAHAARAGRPAAARRGVLRLLDRPRCSCPTWRWPRWPAATSAWGWRTTSTSRAASSATNAQLVERAVAILEAMGVRVLGPGRGARAAGARRHG